MKKIKLLVILVLSFALINTVKTTYSRYASEATGEVKVDIAKWELAINNTDIINNYSSTLNITPVIDANSNVVANKLAPGSTGYFDIIVNPTNVDVSYTYSIIATPADTSFSDFIIQNYEIIDSNGVTLEQSAYSNKIEKNVLYNNSPFEIFTVRVHFIWLDDGTDSLDDEDDTLIAHQITSSTNPTTDINVSINFKQFIQ